MSAALRQRAALTPQELMFLEALREGKSAFVAAESVGLDRREAPYFLARPAISAALDAEIRSNLQIAAYTSARSLDGIAAGEVRCSPVRMDAIKTSLDRSGYNTPVARPAPRFADADLSELSADELRRLVDGLERAKGKTIDALAERAKPVDAPQRNTLDDKLLSLLD